MQQRLTMQKLRFVVGVVAVVATVGVMGYVYLRESDPPTAIEADGTRIQTGQVDTPGAAPSVGKIAPDFVLGDYDGRAVRLSDYRGKTVLLKFWATWCTSCAKEMPLLQRLAVEHPDDLVVLAVNEAESSGTARTWSTERALTALVFALDLNKSVSDAYKLPAGLPHSFFIDEDGYVRVVVHGELTREAMLQHLEETKSPRPAG